MSSSPEVPQLITRACTASGAWSARREDRWTERHAHQPESSF